MNSSEHDEDAPQSVDKGKRRAEDPTERTPLLASSSSTSDDPIPTVARRRLLSKLMAVFLGTLVICVLVCVALAGLAWSYASRASHVSPDDILDQGLVFEGPDRVDVLNITWSGGLWVNVEARVGFDAGSVIGVNSAPDGDGLFEDIWKSIGRWGVRSLDRVSVNMTTIYLTSASDGAVLATIESTPVVVPLTANPPSDSTWLTHISTPLLIRPTHNTSALIHFVREAWREGSAAVRADVGSVEVRGGAFGEDSWRSLIHSALSNVRTALRIRIPPIPGIPQKDPLPSLSELITLQSFNVYSSSGSLDLAACATLPDPAPSSFNLTAPSIPFTIALPTPYDDGADSIPIAAVSTAPFTLMHPNISLQISGSVLPLPASAAASQTLSAFLTRYLSGLPNPILVSTPHVPNLTLDLTFPAPSPRPRILRNVTIHDMAIKPNGKGGAFTASGTVYARVVLPRGMQVALHVGRVLPEVLVFDGEVPEGDEDGDEDGDDGDSAGRVLPSTLKPRPTFFPFPFPFPFPKFPHERKPPHGADPSDPDDDDDESSPFPDPLPPGAFGHIRPDDWLISQSGPVPSDPGDGDESGAAFAVTAKIVDAPLEVLPGRQKEFRKFVSKVIFGSEAAVAGILGVAAVGVDVFGLPLPGGDEEDDGELELHGLPFRGSVLVGKKGVGVGAEHTMSELERLLERFLHWGQKGARTMVGLDGEGEEGGDGGGSRDGDGDQIQTT
ncbi:hypothetical protein K438DRAFT_1839507 [Mycena galopus ATCC 62051]|nr:hypothetical protein K438DRAFT_1839507 [Mycena galopus ATCC 62051]